MVTDLKTYQVVYNPELGDWWLYHAMRYALRYRIYPCRFDPQPDPTQLSGHLTFIDRDALDDFVDDLSALLLEGPEAECAATAITPSTSPTLSEGSARSAGARFIGGLMSLSPKREPAVWIGLAVSILTALQQELADGTVNWEVLLPALVGVAVRFFVVPASEVE